MARGVSLMIAGLALVAAGVIFGMTHGGDDEDPFARPKALRAPAERLGHSVSAFRREQVRRLMTAPRVLGVPRDTLESIADCESGGDPRSVSADGSYRGKYQFDRGTWASMGGEGDPAKAPEYEQDLRAAMLYKRSGGSSWPVCA